MSNLNQDFSLKANKYPGTLSDATDVLLNHKWDPAYKESQKNKRTQREEARKSENNTTGTGEAVGLVQKDKRVCYCCGNEDHLANECPVKDKIPKEDWHVNKQAQLVGNKEPDKNSENEEDA